LPINANGKADRRALAEMDSGQVMGSAVYVAPRTPIEQKVAQWCTQLLQIERVGLYDNFFELGGHSLTATQFVSRVREEFKVKLPLRQLFEAPNIALIAERIEALVKERAEKRKTMMARIKGLSDVEALKQIKELKGL